MKRLIVAVCGVISFLWMSTPPVVGGTVTVNSQAPGAMPFISFLDLTVSDPAALQSIQFVVTPKPGSAVRAVSAQYSATYLAGRGYLNSQTGQVTLPAFGLYANFSNSVLLTTIFKDSSKSQMTVTVPTQPFDDPTGIYINPLVLQARNSKQKLSYDYIMLKGFISGLSPVIIDTEGEVRWVGTAGASSQPSILFQNGIYVGKGTSLVRMEFDGTYTNLANYAGLGVTGFHHNFDPGKYGFLMEVDTTNAQESVIIEVDGAGQPLQTWDMNEIVRNTMLAGGDDPSGFVQEGVDWFHSNACSYQKKGDTLNVSSRENFVIALDYSTGAIQWILGDPTKSWYQYSSLKTFALTLGANTFPPVGQHAISNPKSQDLLLFDDGANSLHQTPPGENRDYSAARRYRLNPKKKTATEIWTYNANPVIYSPYCSSVYEDRPKNYLLDYTLAGPYVSTDILGLTSKGEIAFYYSYPVNQFCGVAWNAIPVHLEKLVFQ